MIVRRFRFRRVHFFQGVPVSNRRSLIGGSQRKME
jgi:hypothetical protein